jgi:hypothetical protein
MHAGKTAKRLENDIQKLQNIINSLVEENYILKTILSSQQSTPTNQPNKSK